MNNYKGLGRALHWVRGAQHYGSIFAEGLILLAFAMSSVDVSIGGKLANIPALAWIWAAAFALGIDTSFILSWVRVREIFRDKKMKKRNLWWAILLALGMSFIVLQPVAIQQLQQGMGESFNAALANLGINLNFLVYARSGVAVLLGAVLAMTNVETQVDSPSKQVTSQTMQVQPVDEEAMQLPMQAESLHSHLHGLVHSGVQVNQSRIAQQFGVSQSTVSRIVKRIKQEAVNGGE